MLPKLFTLMNVFDTDPCHSKIEPFNIISKLILRNHEDSIIIQMHVKSVETCKEDIFISSGYNYIDTKWYI